MSDRNNYVLILVTAPGGQFAGELARKLLGERLVACVNIVPGLRSLYWWEGEVQESDEVLMLLKARGADVDAVAERVRELHPYEVPEVVAAEISGGLQAYLDWVSAETERG
ncbi:MAG: divalent-cation tolerance protein CutA [Gemmatimonadota bacterium]|nr:MAG: divalent-cation tolerance protein CutA [Gemmatimonadota bacterium]